MQTKSVVQMIEADQGLGLQIAKDFVDYNFIVLLRSINFERGEEAQERTGRHMYIEVRPASQCASVSL